MSRRKPYWPSFHGPPSQNDQASQRQLGELGSVPLSQDPAVNESALRYINGYSAELVQKVAGLIERGTLGEHLLKKYPRPHEVNSDKLLRQYVITLKDQYLRSSPPLSKVCFDGRIHLVHNALGTHTFISRRQGSKLKAKHELRISSLFKRSPEPLLKMIVAHELAHLREKEHNATFYQLCVHMDEAYHQHELDARLYLIHQELIGPLYSER